MEQCDAMRCATVMCDGNIGEGETIEDEPDEREWKCTGHNIIGNSFQMDPRNVSIMYIER